MSGTTAGPSTATVRRLVLDTSAYSHLQVHHERVLDLIAGAEIVFLPVTVLGELHAGFELGSRSRENRSLLSEFLAEPFVAVLPTTAGIAERYAQIFTALRRAGRPIPVNDIWIAAATVDCGGHLLSFDRDYERIEGLDCTILPVST